MKISFISFWVILMTLGITLKITTMLLGNATGSFTTIKELNVITPA
nr:MAG TPA: hypothetical protein [Caudoviricetes sp.]